MSPAGDREHPLAAPGPVRPLIFISAVEPSADRHAADVVRAIQRLCPACRFVGVVGPATAAAGCEVIEDWTAGAAMLAGAVRLAGRAWRLLRRIRLMASEKRFSLGILVDSPALHLPLAGRLRRAGCPVLYYIAPQLWAWAPWRIRRVRRRVDRLAVILPFEQDYFRRRGVAAEYVGHPLIEQLAGNLGDPAVQAELRAAGSPIVACLPGSRSHVIAEVLPGQLEVAGAIARRYPQAGFVFAAVHGSAEAAIRAALAGSGLRALVRTGINADLLRVADLALAASGTATLEVACHRVPMVVMYNGSRWGYRLVGRWLIRTEHLCLVNILAGRRIVPEFMPYYTSTDPIAAEALDLLANADRRRRMIADLENTVAALGTGSASTRVAEIALEMIAGGSAGPAGDHPRTDPDRIAIAASPGDHHAGRADSDCARGHPGRSG